MYLQFFGVRGSIPKPITQNDFAQKLESAIQSITPDDLLSTATRNEFLKNLPPWISTVVGGNTACLECKTQSGVHLIFDAGSGIKALGNKIQKQQLHPVHIFLSHLHWDHIQGLPFFSPLFNPNQEIHFYGVHDLEQALTVQMKSPYFPVEYEQLSKKIFFHRLTENSIVKINDVTIELKKMRHPGDSYSYKVTDSDGKNFIYATDVELKAENFSENQLNEHFFANTDLLILDAQYTLTEALEKENWGHSSFCYGIDFATKWNIKKLYLFHHEPEYSDAKLFSILAKSRMYSKFVCGNKISIFLAQEGDFIRL